MTVCASCCLVLLRGRRGPRPDIDRLGPGVGLKNGEFWRSWNKRGAIAQIVGVAASIVIGLATLLLIWWLAVHPAVAKAQNQKRDPNMPIAWWMPFLISASMIATGCLFLMGMRNRRKAVEGAPDSQPTQLPAAQIHALEQSLKETIRERDGARQQLAVVENRLAGRRSVPGTPTIGLVLTRSEVEPYDENPERSYPRKLRLYFNNEGDSIRLGRAIWCAEGVGIQTGKEFGCYYQLALAPGRFDSEASEKDMPSGRRGRLYVGLDSSKDKVEIQRLHKERNLGVLRIPVNVNGVAVVITVRP